MKFPAQMLSNKQIICIFIRWILRPVKVAKTTANRGRASDVKVRQRVNICLLLPVSCEALLRPRSHASDALLFTGSSPRPFDAKHVSKGLARWMS
jgi:hypothetical protein